MTDNKLFFSKENMMTIYNIFSDYLINKKNIKKELVETNETKDFIYKNMILSKETNLSIKDSNISLINKLIDIYLTKYFILDSKNRDINKYPDKYNFNYINNLVYDKNFIIDKLIMYGFYNYIKVTINEEEFVFIIENFVNNNSIMKPLYTKEIDLSGELNIFFDKSIEYTDIVNKEDIKTKQCTYYDTQKNMILIDDFNKININNTKIIIDNDKQNILIFNKIF